MNLAKKKAHKKILIAFKFTWKSFINWSDLEQNYKRIPFEFNLSDFRGKSLLFFPKSQLSDQFLKNVGVALWFWKSLGQLSNLTKI